MADINQPPVLICRSISTPEAQHAKEQEERGSSLIEFHTRNRDPHTTCTPYDHHKAGRKDSTHYNSFSLSAIWLLWWIAQKKGEADRDYASGKISEEEQLDAARYILLVEYTTAMLQDSRNEDWRGIPCPPEDVESHDGPFYFARTASEVLLWGTLRLHRSPTGAQPRWALIDTRDLMEDPNFESLMKFLMVPASHRRFEQTYNELCAPHLGYTPQFRRSVAELIVSNGGALNHNNDIPLNWRISLEAALQCGSRTVWQNWLASRKLQPPDVG